MGEQVREASKGAVLTGWGKNSAASFGLLEVLSPQTEGWANPPNPYRPPVSAMPEHQRASAEMSLDYSFQPQS